jgi:hypothetical protein
MALVGPLGDAPAACLGHRRAEVRSLDCRLLTGRGGDGRRQAAAMPGNGPLGGFAQVVPHMPPVGNLDRQGCTPRRSLGITARPVPTDDLSVWTAASGAPRGRDGQVEAIRALMVAKRTARAERTQTINQARALVLTGPDDIRAPGTVAGFWSGWVAGTLPPH